MKFMCCPTTADVQFERNKVIAEQNFQCKQVLWVKEQMLYCDSVLHKSGQNPHVYWVAETKNLITISYEENLDSLYMQKGQ